MKGSRDEAKAYALKLLSYRARSKKELLGKLRGKGFTGRQIERTIGLLERADLINDSSLAKDLYTHTAVRKHLGRKGIEGLLSRRGIDRGLIEQILGAHSGEREEEAARSLVRKKLKVLKHHPEEVIRRRLWGMLQRRGFAGDVIRQAVDSVF